MLFVVLSSVTSITYILYCKNIALYPLKVELSNPSLCFRSDVGVGQSQDDSIVGLKQSKQIPASLPVSSNLSSSNPDLLQSHHRILDFNNQPGEDRQTPLLWTSSIQLYMISTTWLSSAPLKPSISHAFIYIANRAHTLPDVWHPRLTHPFTFSYTHSLCSFSPGRDKWVSLLLLCPRQRLSSLPANYFFIYKRPMVFLKLVSKGLTFNCGYGLGLSVLIIAGIECVLMGFACLNLTGVQFERNQSCTFFTEYKQHYIDPFILSAYWCVFTYNRGGMVTSKWFRWAYHDFL